MHASPAQMAAMNERARRPCIALVAGEASGDQLGAALIGALRELMPDAAFVGVGGPAMRREGLQAWWDSEELAVMGLFEVVRHLPRLLGLRRRLLRRIRAMRPDVLIGIDSPDFNLGLERRARAAGIRTAHYVSPTVWAWRRGRVRSIAKSTDRVLCLFPFEPEFYARQGVPADYTGHPLADSLASSMDQASARQALALDAGADPLIALLPGSRASEAERLSRPLLEAAVEIARGYPEARFVAPMSGKRVQQIFGRELERFPALRCRVIEHQATTAMAAADVVVCASGTAALEAMLVNRPLVVVYRLSPLTYYLGKALRLVKSRFISLPNILADEPLVPELLQHEVNAQRIFAEVQYWLDHPRQRSALAQKFQELHRRLRCDAAATAARCIQGLLTDGQRPVPQ